MLKIKSLFKDNKIKTLFAVLIFIAISCLLEVFLFNYQSFLHLFNREPIYNASDFNINIGSDVIDNGDGTYTLDLFTKNIETNNLDNSTLKSNEIEITNINKKIQTVQIDITSKFVYSANVVTYITDKSNALYLELPNVEISQYSTRSTYIQLHTNGETNKIKFSISPDDIMMNTFTINGIYFNKAVPFQFNFYRVLFISLFFMIIYAIRPKSSLHSIIYNSKNKTHKKVIIGFLIIIIISTIFISFSSMQFGKSLLNDYCDAILSGHLSISDAPQTIINMENPYDTNYRNYLLSENNENYTFDTAYYNGKIYVYFGILPVLLLYVPAKALLGIDLTTNKATLIIALLSIIAIYLFVKQINRIWFKNKMSIIMFMASIWFMVFGANVVSPMLYSEFYEVLPMSASCCCIFGLTAWLKSINDKGNLKKSYLAIGSICMACSVLCKPTYLLVSILAIPLFWSRMFKNILKKNKSNFINCICFITPYIVIGIITMILNYIRFGSIISFGDKYQLTVTDMNSSFDISKLGYGLFVYLLQPPIYSPIFPYIFPTKINTNYQGYYFTSLSYGSIFLSYPITLSIFAINHIKDYIKQKDKSLYSFCLTAIIIGFINVIAVTVLGGICDRYSEDFMLLFIIASVIIFMCMLEKYRNTKVYKYLILFMITAIIITSILLLSRWVGGEMLMIKLQKPELYYSTYYAFNFFL